MSTLTPAERERFASWLEADAETDDLLLAQMIRVAIHTVFVDEKRADVAAKRRVARQLRATDSFVGGEAAPEPEEGEA